MNSLPGRRSQGNNVNIDASGISGINKHKPQQKPQNPLERGLSTMREQKVVELPDWPDVRQIQK
jgi:hypothetical protein